MDDTDPNWIRTQEHIDEVRDARRAAIPVLRKWIELPIHRIAKEAGMSTKTMAEAITRYPSYFVPAPGCRRNARLASQRKYTLHPHLMIA